ncbi:heavy metal-associated isoprenylated plant protein 9 isoform X3 [Mangifera indica]|uniref:heavy metal-associated isoprenylated plant protein 9 isoform X3 n=1 Tax=Mangifera indica TaxID=29780 RepID=UPI001CF993D6|nr:heavy metal-associated isoprenylated plant protein 9 isoform X3 [Mangifera indica]
MGEEVKQEQAKAEEKKEEKVEEKKKEKQAEEVKEEPKPPSPLVLYVNLHCVGCAKKLEKSIMKIRGVEGITIDMPQNQLTIKGIVEPQAVCEKIMKKTKRIAKVLSPLPATEGEPMPEVVTSQVSGLTTVELSVNMHCEACAEQLKKKILKMRGVRTVETDLSAEKVTVTGTMDGNKLVDYVYRRTKKQAKIVPQPEPAPQPAPQPEPQPEQPPAEKKKEEETKPAEEKKEEEKPKEEVKKEEKKEEIIYGYIGEENMKRMMYLYQPVYVIEHIPPPQLFSDENPNACTIT